jgi:hypothetical protein
MQSKGRAILAPGRLNEQSRDFAQKIVGQAGLYQKRIAAGGHRNLFP